MSAARFDWYEVTFDDADEGLVASHLASLLGARLVEHKGRNGYAIAYAVVRGDDELARVFGRSARWGEVHIEVTGQSCDEIVPIIRERWPAHRVSRADVALDFVADFSPLDWRAVRFAEERNVSYRLITDSAGGATRYLGSKSSEFTVRLYKKTEQLRALYPSRADSVPDGLVRVELQMRPGKRATKERAAAMTPDQFWGFSRWGKEFAAEFLNVSTESAPTHSRRPSEWSRLLATLERQYGPGVQRRVQEVGGAEVVKDLLRAFGITGDELPAESVEDSTPF